jgi:hypothetical protein
MPSVVNYPHPKYDISSRGMLFITTASNGSGPSLRVRVQVQTEPKDKLAVQVVNSPQPSTQVRFDIKLRTHLNLVGCPQVAKLVPP